MRINTVAFASLVCAVLGAILLFILALSRPNLAIATSSLPPAQRTGAPGEGNCGSCHNGSLLKNGSISISIGTSEYAGGQTYPVSVTIQDPLQTRWGFEITALKNSDNTKAGSFQSADDLTGTQAAGGRAYAGQNSNGAVVPLDPNDGTHWGTLNGPVTWVVNWTAPPQGSGTVTFYVAGVAADGDGIQDALDYSYTTNRQLSEQRPTPVTEMTWGKIKQRYR